MFQDNCYFFRPTENEPDYLPTEEELTFLNIPHLTTQIRKSLISFLSPSIFAKDQKLLRKIQ